MSDYPESLAWLTRRDGGIIVGYGGFKESATAPADRVAFYRQDFALSDPRPWKIPKRTRITNAKGLASLFPRPDTSPNIQWSPLDAAPFSVVFQEVLSSIQSGIFEKSVPVVTETGRADQALGSAIASAMAQLSAPLQSYGWIDGDSGFAGATPELLFSLDERRLETMALAGTARSEDRDVFAVDEKEIREHEYVAQTLVSKLLDLGHLERDDRRILNLGSIVHFLTLIQVDLDAPMAPETLLKKLHPTPALGPLPRTDGTMERLLDWRNRLGCPAEFGAPFGLLTNGSFEAVVAIRGIWWDDRTARLPAGCGVIEASRLVNEWRELRLKREAVKRRLGHT